jgi:elongation factor 2
MADKNTEKISKLMRVPTQIRNIGVCAHIDHGKTTFSDNLLAGAGMMSEDLAGKQRALDFHDDEQERGITIDSANVSMVHNVEGKDYLINLIDTPGHVDFGGDVTRAMRAVDGAIVLSCAVEGIMPQTETVLRQALKELVKPVLFINKVDRLIKEVKLTPEQMTAKFVKIIDQVNELIMKLAPKGYGEKWQLSVQDGSVAFGSAFHNWALSFPYMKKKGLTFKDVIEAYENDTFKELAKKAPIHEVVLDMVIGHHPNPKDSQVYRIPRIWHGDQDSANGKGLMTCDPTANPSFVVVKIVMDKHAGEVAAGRIFSGTFRHGQEVYMNMAKKKVRLQQVSVYKGAQRVALDEVYPGNIVGFVGLKGVVSGETVSVTEMEPFEAIKHVFDPVITKSIRVNNSADLPKLVEILGQVGKEDPSIKIEINEETGENLISGMGELHLEVIENRIKSEKGLSVTTSPPIVVYRETVNKRSGEFEGKSPNKHNKLYFVVEPLDETIGKAIRDGDLHEGRIRKKDKETVQTLISLGLDTKEAKNYSQIYNGNVLIDNTKGIVHIGEIIGLVQDGFEQVMKKGGLADEPVTKVRVRLMDCKLHEDSIHRGPAQMYPAVREGIRAAMLDARPSLLEPLQVMQLEAPEDYMGELSKLVQNKRGQLVNMETEGGMVVVKAVMPVAEMFGWSSDLRSATSGRGSSFIKDQKFERVPDSIQAKVVDKIRTRKGIKKKE